MKSNIIFLYGIYKYCHLTDNDGTVEIIKHLISQMIIQVKYYTWLIKIVNFWNLSMTKLL